MRCAACSSCKERVPGQCVYGGPYRYGPAVYPPEFSSLNKICAACGGPAPIAPHSCLRRGLVARARYHNDSHFGGPDVDFCSAACRTAWSMPVPGDPDATNQKA